MKFEKYNFVEQERLLETDLNISEMSDKALETKLEIEESEENENSSNKIK